LQLTWFFSEDDAVARKGFVAAHAKHALVLDRARLNVRRQGIDITAATAWKVFIGCLVTTQQRSGTGSTVSRFLDSGTTILNLRKLLESKSIEMLARHELSKAGLRRNEIIADQISSAVDYFGGKKWKTVSESLESILTYPTLRKERKVAAFLSGTFKGLGPKQSRNFIQWIGLSRYAVPLDSRFSKHLREISFPVPVAATALQDEGYYCFIEDGVQKLAELAECYPCMYDASVFASFENAA